MPLVSVGVRTLGIPRVSGKSPTDLRPTHLVVFRRSFFTDIAVMKTTVLECKSPLQQSG